MDEKLILHNRAVGPWGTNAYGLICPRSGESVLIDPGGDPDQLFEMLAGSRPIAVLVTHSHPDHTGALSQMRDRLKAPVMAHRGNPATASQVAADRWLADGERIKIGRCRVNVRHTPGHCDDQICILIENDHHAIVGDTLFEGGPGKTWSPAGFEVTLDTLREIVLTWSDDTICHPGHGSSFRLGDIRDDIAAFTRKDHGDFCGDATWGMSARMGQ